MEYPPGIMGRDHGVTLIELLVTITIVSILLTVAVPALSSLVSHNAMTTQANTLIAHLHLARSEAIKRGSKVTLCPSQDRLTCLSTIEWHHGYILFIDENENTSIDGEEQLLKTHLSSSSRGEVYSTSGRKRLVYKPDGSAKGYNVTFAICDGGDILPPRYLILSETGRPRLSDTKASRSKASCQ